MPGCAVGQQGRSNSDQALRKRAWAKTRVKTRLAISLDPRALLFCTWLRERIALGSPETGVFLIGFREKQRAHTWLVHSISPQDSSRSLMSLQQLRPRFCSTKLDNLCPKFTCKVCLCQVGACPRTCSLYFNCCRRPANPDLSLSGESIRP